MRGPTNKAWEEFVTWCQQRGLSAVPANPWTLAAYARWCALGHRPQTVRKRVRDIARVHEAKTRKRLDRAPLVTRTLDMIETRDQAAKQDAGLFEDEDFLEPKPARKGRRKVVRKAAKDKPASKAKSARAGLSSQPPLVSRRKLKGYETCARV